MSVSMAMKRWITGRRRRSSSSHSDQMTTTPVPRHRNWTLANLPLLGGGKPSPPPKSKTAPVLPFPSLGPRGHVESSEPSNNTLKSPTDSAYAPSGNSAMPVITTFPRNTVGPLPVDSPMAPDPNPTPPGWARPNAHSAAQQQSKTSQYIDKITSENEKLKRELKAERLAREDEAKRVTAARSKAEDSRAEHQHLQLLVDTNSRALERKDRKLEELKAQLEVETKRRKSAEQRAEEALKMLGDTRSETQRQLALAYEQKHLAETNADTAREGYKRMTDGYEKKVRYITEQLNELRQKQYEDADKIKRQAIVSDQLQHEVSRTQRTEDKMVDMMGQYKREHRKEMDSLTKEAERMRVAVPEKENQAATLVREMEETRDKMKWVMAQEQRQRDL